MKKRRKQIFINERLMKDFPNAPGCFEWYQGRTEYS